MLPLPVSVIFLAGGAVGLLLRPAYEERQKKKKDEEAKRIADAIALALKNLEKSNG